MIGPIAHPRIAALLLSIAAAPFAAEGLYSLLPAVTAFQRQPEGVDRRTRRELITELRVSGIDAVPAIQPALLLERRPDRSLVSAIKVNGAEVLPLGGLANKETILCNETGQYVLYRSDEHGFHNPNAIWSLPKLDVAAVGDSLTHGACVSSDKSAVARIRSRYPATLNLGISHNGPLFLLAAIREYLPALAPRHVLWFHSESDLLDLAFEKRSRLLQRYLRDDAQRQDLRRQQAAIDASLAEYVSQRLNPDPEQRRRDARLGLDRAFASGPQQTFSPVRVLKLTETRRLLNSLTSDASSDGVADEEWKLFAEILTRARDTVRSWDGQLYVIYLPSFGRYVRLGSTVGDYHRVLAAAKGLDIPVIDTAVEFDARPDPKTLFARARRDAHYTEEGYRIVADRVLAVLAGADGDASH